MRLQWENGPGMRLVYQPQRGTDGCTGCFRGAVLPKGSGSFDGHRWGVSLSLFRGSPSRG